MMQIIMNTWLWIGMSILFILGTIGLSILLYLIFQKSHLTVELKAKFSKTPIGIFFQDNRFAEWKPVTPINGVVNDKYYGPFIVSNTYVDKKTKAIVMAFDVDMDGDRTSDTKQLVEYFRHATNNEKNIALLRQQISAEGIEESEHVKNVTSTIKYAALKGLFNSTSPHNIRSKIEKIVAERVKNHGNVNHMHAIITFVAIFGLIVGAAILLKIMGIV